MGTVILGNFLLSAQIQQPKDRDRSPSSQFVLSKGQSATYRGAYTLDLSLVEIGKLADLFRAGGLSAKGVEFRHFSETIGKMGSCSDETDIAVCLRENNYYVLRIQHGEQSRRRVACGAEERLVVISSLFSETYTCPDAFLFNVNSTESDNAKVNFTIDYMPLGLN